MLNMNFMAKTTDSSGIHSACSAPDQKKKTEELRKVENRNGEKLCKLFIEECTIFPQESTIKTQLLAVCRRDEDGQARGGGGPTIERKIHASLNTCQVFDFTLEYTFTSCVV